jgi:hypothetical protein
MESNYALTDAPRQRAAGRRRFRNVARFVV